MRVRITQSTLPTYWYAEQVGELFDVDEKQAIPFSQNTPWVPRYVVKGYSLGNIPLRFIDVDDCVAVCPYCDGTGSIVYGDAEQPCAVCYEEYPG